MKYIAASSLRKPRQRNVFFYDLPKILGLGEQANNSNFECFVEIIRPFQKQVYRYLLMRCQNKYDAQDILKSLLANAFKEFSGKQKCKCFKVRLFSQLKELFRKNRAYSNQYKDLLLLDMSYELKQVQIDESCFWTHVKHLLSEDCYDILWYIKVEKFSIKEIAEIYHCNCLLIYIKLLWIKQKVNSVSNYIALNSYNLVA